MLATGRVGQVARHRVGGAAAEPRRVRLRHLRRRALPRQGDGRGGRRRHGAGRSPLPDALRHEGDTGPSARRAARLASIMQERALATTRRSSSRGTAWWTRCSATTRSPACACKRHSNTDATREIPVEAVFVAIGHKPNTDLITGQIALDEVGYVKVDPGTTRTTVEGVFACGDAMPTRSTGRRSPRPGPAAWPPSTPSAGSPSRASASSVVPLRAGFRPPAARCRVLAPCRGRL